MYPAWKFIDLELQFILHCLRLVNYWTRSVLEEAIDSKSAFIALLQPIFAVVKDVRAILSKFGHLKHQCLTIFVS